MVYPMKTPKDTQNVYLIDFSLGYPRDTLVGASTVQYSIRLGCMAHVFGHCTKVQPSGVTDTPFRISRLIPFRSESESSVKILTEDAFGLQTRHTGRHGRLGILPSIP